MLFDHSISLFYDSFMKALLLILIFLPMAHAAFIVSPGVSITNAQRSDEKAPDSEELLVFDSAMGISIDAEWTFLNDSIGLTSGVLWKGGLAEAEYSYTNPRNPLDTATVSDLKTNSSSLTAFIGPRFRFINYKYFKIFAGAGWMPGILYLSYNENKFLLANGSLVGFKEKEQQSFKGNYFEAGVELHSTHGGALRLIGKKTQQRTDRFETLGDKQLDISSSILTIQYMHLF